MLELAQDRTAGKEEKIPFLSVGEDIGNRTLMRHGTLGVTGDYSVEDVSEGGKRFRRLVFMSMRTAVQSEVRLQLKKFGSVKGKPKGKKGKKKSGKRQATSGASEEKQTTADDGWSVDHSFLCFDVHAGLAACLALVDPALLKRSSTSEKAEPRARAVVVGLGGGSLASFLAKHFPQLQVHPMSLLFLRFNLSCRWMQWSWTHKWYR